MLNLLLITLFLSIPSIINAAHMDAFIWDEGRLISSKGKDMYNMIRGNTIYYYYKSGLKEPSCGITIQSEKPDENSKSRIFEKNVATLSGDDFDDKTCIKPYADLWYFKAPECQWVSYKSPPNVKIINTTASCNKYGCLTRYGWVYLQDTCYYKKNNK